MIKALLKKQFMELNTFYFKNRKTGKRRSSGAVFGIVLLMGSLLLSVAVLFYAMAEMLGSAMIPAGMDWLYFAIMGLSALFLSTLLNSLQAFSALYIAKDNELLLAMPIAPSKILLVRMVGTYVMGFLYEAVVLLPTVFVYWFHKESPSAAQIVFPLVFLFLVGFLVLVFTCLFGFVIAAISSRLRNKSAATVLLSLLILTVYYVCYFKMNELLTSVIQNIDSIGAGIQKYVFVLYHMGLAASGNAFSLLLVAAMVLSAFVLTYWILSLSFLRIATANRGAKKAVYREKTLKASSLSMTLLKRELRHFSKSPVYMLNCGLGIVLLLLGAVLAVFKANDLRAVLGRVLAQLPTMRSFVPILATVAVGLVVSMDGVTAPSVSLEGRSLWILRTSPIPSAAILQAKENMHLLLNVLPAVVLAAALGWVIGAELYTIVCMALAVTMQVWFSAKFGLIMNLKKPNLDWTTEAVPVKQGLSVLFSMMGGWVVSVAIAGVYYLFFLSWSPWLYLLAVAGVFGAVTAIEGHWIKTRGIRIWESL